MKILFVVGPFPLPSETFILNQLTGLIERGHEIHIYATQRAEVSDILHADVEKYDLLKRTRFRKQVPMGKISSRLGRMRLACELGISDPGMLYRALNAKKYVKRISSQVIIADVQSLRGLPRFDIIHCHFGFHGNRAMALREIGALQGKLITTFHAVDLTVNLNVSGRHVYDNLFAKGDLFLPISQRWRQRLIELGCDDARIRVHHMGIDCKRFTFRSREPSGDGPLKIASVARLVEKKGLEYGIRAVARLKKDCPNVEYTIVGDGPLRADLERLIGGLDLQDCVRLAGWQEQHRIVEIMEKSHIFMAPSVTASNGDQEGIPVVLMEAMAMGLPVVSTRHSGIPELVEDGLSGCLVPERDVDGLYEKLKYLSDNPDQWVEMGRQGRKIVEEQYDINVLNDRLVQMYRSV